MKHGATWNTNFIFCWNELKTCFCWKITWVFHFAPDDFAFQTAPSTPTTRLLIENLKKIEFRVGKKSIFSQKLRHFRKIRHFVLLKKVFFYKSLLIKRCFECSQGFLNRFKIGVLRPKLRKYRFLTPFWMFRPFCQISKSQVGFFQIKWLITNRFPPRNVFSKSR
jgi:hypothetical protein